MHTPQLADNLRRALLQAAIEGKLTERQADDGHAQDLLKQIQAEKAAQIQAGRLKKSKGLPEIGEDEKPFEIPENWVWVRLGEVFNIVRGGSPRPIQNFLTDDENGVNWIKIGDTDIGGKYIDQIKEKIILEGVSKSRFIKSGSLLLTNSMSYGRPYILRVDGCIHDGWLALEPLNDGISKEYVFYVISSRTVREQFSQTVAGAVVKNLNSDKVKETLIPLPPLAEQARIVAKLDALLAETDALKAQESALADAQKNFPKMLRASLLQAAIEGKLTERESEDGHAQELLQQIQAEKAAQIQAGRLKKSKGLPEIGEDEKPFTIPENWVWVRLGEIGSWSSGATPNRSNPDFYRNGEINWLKTGDLNDGYIKETSEKITALALEKCSVTLQPVGSVLIAMYGATIGKLGILDIPSTTNQACCACIPFDGILNKYLFYFLIFNRSNFILMGAGGAQPNISKEKIVSTVMPLPPLAEQARIVAKLDALLAQIESLENLS